MQTELVAMSQAYYESYVAQSWCDYAEENVATLSLATGRGSRASPGRI